MTAEQLEDEEPRPDLPGMLIAPYIDADGELATDVLVVVPPGAEDAVLVEFATDPSSAVHSVVTRAAQADRVGSNREAQRLTHLACALVEGADNPLIQRGAVLTNLVRRYGDGFPKLDDTPAP